MDFQVSIVGGGVAGALLALSLGKSGISTCLIELAKWADGILIAPKQKFHQRL